MAEREKKPKKAGVCIPWEERVKEYPKLTGDPEIVKKVWQDVDTLAYVYVWSTLTLF